MKGSPYNAMFAGLIASLFAAQWLHADYVSNLVSPSELGTEIHGIVFRYQSSERIEGSKDRDLTFIIQAASEEDQRALRTSKLTIQTKPTATDHEWSVSPQTEDIEEGIRFRVRTNEFSAKLMEINVLLPNRTVYDTHFSLRVADYWSLGLGSHGTQTEAQHDGGLKG